MGFRQFVQHLALAHRDKVPRSQILCRRSCHSCFQHSLYLLIGFVCAALYYGIELFQGNPEIATTFTGNLGVGPPRVEALYYSFVTLTTLGFGDIAPIAQPTRALSIVEALIGQLFLVTMMARLVSLQVAHSGDETTSEV